MPRRFDKPIIKRGINFYEEDITRLQTFFPPRQINRVVRELVHRWLGIIETKAHARAGGPPQPVELDLEALDLDAIKQDVGDDEDEQAPNHQGTPSYARP